MSENLRPAPQDSVQEPSLGELRAILSGNRSNSATPSRTTPNYGASNSNRSSGPPSGARQNNSENRRSSGPTTGAPQVNSERADASRVGQEGEHVPSQVHNNLGSGEGDTSALQRVAQAADSLQSARGDDEEQGLDSEHEDFAEDDDVLMAYSDEEVEVSNECFNNPDCFYSKQLASQSVSDTLCRQLHWCKFYIAELASGSRINWLPGHKEGMRRFCIHHAWYGEGKAWKNMSQSQMASKLLEEIGGCKQEYDFCKAFVPKVVKCLKNTGEKMKKAGLIGPVRKVDLAGMAITVEGRHQPRSTKFSWDQRFYKTASEYTSEEDCRNALALLHERIRANGLLAKFPELDNMSCIKDGPTGAELLQEDTYEEQFKDTPLSLPKLPRSMDSEEENDRFLAARERKFRSLPSPMRSSPSGRSTKRRKHQAHHASDEDYEGDDFDDYEDSDRHHQRPTNSPSKQGRKRQKAGSSPRSSKNHRQGS